MQSQEHLVLSASVELSASGMACTVAPSSPVAAPARRTKARDAGFDGPRHVVWEITSECDEAAGHRGPAELAHENLTTAESLALIDELARSGVVNLIFAGEPLARADWPALVGRAVARGLAVEVETSGALITEHTAAELAALGVSVVVSIDSHLAEEHDALRVASGRHAGRHDHAVAAVRLLAACGAAVVVGFTATRRNWWDAAEVVTLACALRAGAVRFVEYAAGTCGRADLVLRPDELTAARTTWRELAQHYRGHIDISWQGMESATGDDTRSCTLIPRIRPDGTLTPGALSATCIGSFRRRSLRDIWTRSPLVAWLQNKHHGAPATGSPAAGSSAARRRRMVE